MWNVRLKNSSVTKIDGQDWFVVEEWLEILDVPTAWSVGAATGKGRYSGGLQRLRP